jgi:beta-glucanase (GH16 family)
MTPPASEPVPAANPPSTLSQNDDGAYKPDPAKWQLVWSDEFDKDGPPDSSKWTIEQNNKGGGNRELQAYTDSPNNIRVENGNLVIEARKEKSGGMQYTSGRMNSRGKAEFTYGRIEARIKLPHGRGIWPAFWMLGTGGSGWPRCGEIDIMEYVGYQPGEVHGTVHTGAFNHMKGTQQGNHTTIGDCEDQYHVYAVEWYSKGMRFFVDGQHYFTFARQGDDDDKWPFDKPAFIIFNFAVGGDWGGIKGVDASVYPQKMLVDYVRAYKQISGDPTGAGGGGDATKSDVHQFGK